MVEQDDTPALLARIHQNAVPHRIRREWDDNWNLSGDPVCPICRREVPELFPCGWAGKRTACIDCINRRRRLLEYRAKILSTRRARPASVIKPLLP